MMTNGTKTVEEWLAELTEKVAAVETAILQPAGLDGQTVGAWYVGVVLVEGTDWEANTKRGPDIPVPKGYEVSVKMRQHATATTNGYVAPSKDGTRNTLTRKELRGGESFTLRTGNLKNFYFLADAATVYFELTVECQP